MPPVVRCLELSLPTTPLFLAYSLFQSTIQLLPRCPPPPRLPMPPPPSPLPPTLPILNPDLPSSLAPLSQLPRPTALTPILPRQSLVPPLYPRHLFLTLSPLPLLPRTYPPFPPPPRPLNLLNLLPDLRSPSPTPALELLYRFSRQKRTSA
jgi:hypothetical protein